MNASGGAGLGLGTLEAQLGHVFNDASLLDRARTHRSTGSVHNERLEFLGDAVLGFVIAHILHRAHPGATEGELTRWRAALVRRPTLAEIGRDIGLGAHLRLGGGELKAGGRDRESILADAVEAALGAVLLDGGVDACEAVIQRLFGVRLASVAIAPPGKDPKTRLQEWLQQRSLPLPRYEMLDDGGAGAKGAAAGEPSRPVRVQCLAAPLAEPTKGEGNSRRRAEQAAAARALTLLEADGPTGHKEFKT